MIAQFICDYSGQAAIDDGTIATLEANFNAAIQSANRIKVPTAGVNLYVATAGNDTNNGLTVGSPFLTIQHAANIANSNYDTQGNNITIEVAAGTYSAGASLSGQPVGGGQIRFIGNTASPSSVIITLGAPGSCFAASTGSRMAIYGMQLSAPLGSSAVGQTPGTCITATGGAQVACGNLVLGATQFGHFQTASGGQISPNTPYSISGGAGYHVISGAGGQINIAGEAITLVGTPNFSSYFAWADSAGNIFTNSANFSGAATGARYLCSNGGSISTGGGGINFLPGNAVGNSAGGYYS